MGRIHSAVTKANTMKFAAALLAGSSLLSSLLGLLRDRLLNSTYYFTQPDYLDAYTAAFLIPDFMFFVLVSGALSVSFIPVFNDRFLTGNKKSAWQLSSSLMNLLAAVTMVASILIIIFADVLVNAIWGGMGEAARGLAASMMRVIAINPFLFSISSVITSMQQAVGRFVFNALAPVIYNIGIIIGLVWFTNGIHIFGVTIFEGGIMGVALGVVLGSVLQLVVSAIGLIGLGFDYDFKIFWKNHGFRQVLRLLPARSLDQGIDYVNGLVESGIASRFDPGSIRAYNQALTLHSVPTSLIGVAISTAAFPQMTARLSQGRPDLFRTELQKTLRVIIWLALPVAVIAFFARGYLVSFLFNGGEQVIADTLAVLCVAIVFRSIYQIASRSFYAQKDTRTPLAISLFSIALNIVLAITFGVVWQMKLWGLALAQSLVSAIEVLILFIAMSRRIPKLFDAKFVASLGRMFAAASLMGIFTYASVKLFDLQATDQSFWTTFPKFALISTASAAVYLWLSLRLHLSEARPVVHKLKKFLFSSLNSAGVTKQ